MADSDSEFTHPDIYSEIPDGLEIKQNRFGLGIFATKSFKSGEPIYKGECVLIADKPGSIKLKTSHGGEYILDVMTHSVKQWDDNTRQLYAFDGFMNHSCEANSISVLTHKDKECQGYIQQAIKDVNPGDEITCDYNYFEYDCLGKVIEECQCGCANCLGSVKGFKFLPLNEQLKRWTMCDETVIDAFLADNPNVIYCNVDKIIPDSIRIINLGEHEGRPTFKTVANRRLESGDIIFENNSIYFLEGKRIIITVTNITFELDTLSHTINRYAEDGKWREFYTYDTFMNHSCDPNTLMKYYSKSHYAEVAQRVIEIDEELTCDYETFDSMADGWTFECLCGSSKCRGMIHG